VQPHKTAIDHASSVSLSRNINGHLFDDGLTNFTNNPDPVHVFGDYLRRGFRLPLAKRGRSARIRRGGCVPARLGMTRP